MAAGVPDKVSHEVHGCRVLMLALKRPLLKCKCPPISVGDRRKHGRTDLGRERDSDKPTCACGSVGKPTCACGFVMLRCYVAALHLQSHPWLRRSQRPDNKALSTDTVYSFLWAQSQLCHNLLVMRGCFLTRQFWTSSALGCFMFRHVPKNFV